MKNRASLSASCLIELIEKQRFGVEYQPIIDVKKQEVFAYECLARFYDNNNQPIRPDLVYASLHDSLLSLFQVEYQQRKIQLSYAPSNIGIFVNLDQDSYFSSGEIKDENPLLKLFKNSQKLEIAHSAGKKVILEGVETEVDLQLAKSLKVDFVQGFLYKKQFRNVT